MSKSFIGVTFANQNVTPADDAVVMRHTLTDGILTGCGLTYTDDILTMDKGYLIACGRLIRHPSVQDWVINEKTSGYARVIMTIDLNRAATIDIFDQVNVSVEYADSASEFSLLVKEDINAAGSMYQTVIAEVSLGVGGITGITSKIGMSGTGIASGLPSTDGAGAHNSIYRGKYLGSTVTDEQWAAIASGSFKDLYIGDYWTIGGVTYRIAAFDYYYNTGDTKCDTHHVTLVPDEFMYKHVMNDSNVTTGGYVGSKMYTTGLADAKTTINNAFGSAHILTHRQYLCNAVSSGKPYGSARYDSTVELMTEQNVYGGKVFGAGNDGSTVPALYTVDKSQYPLFAFRPDLISNLNWFWLRDVVSASHFAGSGDYGNTSYDYASVSRGVRPAFSICA